VGGKPEPLFVIGTCVDTNTGFVGQGDHHPGLYRTALRLEAPHWVLPSQQTASPSETTFGLRIRYRQPLQAGTLVCDSEGQWFMDFKDPQRGVAAGQFAAWHAGDDGTEVIGSAVISE